MCVQFAMLSQKYNDLRQLSCRYVRRDLQKHNQVNHGKILSRHKSGQNLSSRIVFIMTMPTHRDFLKQELGVEGFHILLVAGHAGGIAGMDRFCPKHRLPTSSVMLG